MPEANLFVEKRSNPRVPIKIPVKFRQVEDLTGIQNIIEKQKNDNIAHSGDMSLGGIYIVASERLEIGTILHLDFHLPENTKHLTSFAEVVWSKESGAGLRFIMIKSEDMETLQNFLNGTAPK